MKAVFPSPNNINWPPPLIEGNQSSFVQGKPNQSFVCCFLAKILGIIKLGIYGNIHTEVQTLPLPKTYSEQVSEEIKAYSSEISATAMMILLGGVFFLSDAKAADSSGGFKFWSITLLTTGAVGLLAYASIKGDNRQANVPFLPFLETEEPEIDILQISKMDTLVRISIQDLKEAWEAIKQNENLDSAETRRIKTSEEWMNFILTCPPSNEPLEDKQSQNFIEQLEKIGEDNFNQYNVFAILQSPQAKPTSLYPEQMDSSLRARIQALKEAWEEIGDGDILDVYGEESRKKGIRSYKQWVDFIRTTSLSFNKKEAVQQESKLSSDRTKFVNLMMSIDPKDFKQYQVSAILNNPEAKPAFLYREEIEEELPTFPTVSPNA